MDPTGHLYFDGQEWRSSDDKYHLPKQEKHIVNDGENLTDISRKYKIDLDVLKALNTQLLEHPKGYDHIEEGWEILLYKKIPPFIIPAAVDGASISSLLKLKDMLESEPVKFTAQGAEVSIEATGTVGAGLTANKGDCFVKFRNTKTGETYSAHYYFEIVIERGFNCSIGGDASIFNASAYLPANISMESLYKSYLGYFDVIKAAAGLSVFSISVSYFESSGNGPWNGMSVGSGAGLTVTPLSVTVSSVYYWNPDGGEASISRYFRRIPNYPTYYQTYGGIGGYYGF